MTLYWCFRLGPVARRILYLDEVKQTRTRWDLVEAIDDFRCRCPAVREEGATPDANLDRRSSR
jgi:hypothetical protein